jgi:hypothetical protein
MSQGVRCLADLSLHLADSSSKLADLALWHADAAAVLGPADQGA